MITIDSIKKTALLTGGLFLSVLSANADNKAIDFNYLRTPEASAFKKYGEESVNEYTGTADISVPLYTIKSKNIEIPLVLRYDASGIKVEQEASWVGLGWNLMVGGCINYVCAGGHDMYQAPDISTKTWTEYLTSSFGMWNTYGETASRSRDMYYTYNSSDRSNWMSKIPLRPQDYIQSYVDQFIGGNGRSELNDYIDWGYGERDFYSVNVMGKSFMFFIDPATLKVFYIGKGGEEFVVTPKYSGGGAQIGIGNQPDIDSFTITDSNGYKYYFAVGDKSQWDSRNGQFYTSCWYLTEIKSPLGETVNFYYCEHNKEARKINNESLTFPIPHGACCNNVVSSKRTTSAQSENSNMHLTVHYLDSIKTANQIVVFSTANSNECSGKKLNSIKVRSCDGTKNGTLIKTISFSYKSFECSNIGGNYASTNNTTKEHRLKLNNVKEFVPGDTLTTSFYYNELALPSKNSCAQDYWGYYNGKGNNVNGRYTMLPTPQSFMSSGYTKKLSEYKGIGGADRNSDSIYMQAAILNKIVYPTGGYTKYEYEPNRCVVPQSESDRPYDQDIKKYFSYTPDVPAGVNPVSNVPYNFTLKEELDFTLSVHCSGDAIDGQSFNVIIAGGTAPKVIPVTYKSSNDFKVVLQDKLPAGSYQLLIGAPNSGKKCYSICCNLTGYYKSSQTQKTFTKKVGGLRVKKISNFDNNGSMLNYTTYSYSGGVLLNKIETIDYVSCNNYSPGQTPGVHTIEMYTITPGHPRMPAFYASCNPGIVGYSIVTKSKYNANNNLEKKIVTSYRNKEPECMYGIEYYKSFDNGVITSQEIYDESNSIVAKTENTYKNDTPPIHYATNIVTKNKSINGGGATAATYMESVTIYNNGTPSGSKTVKWSVGGSQNVYDVLRYPYILSRTNLLNTTTTEYGSNGSSSSIVKTKNYSYNNINHQVSQIDENTSWSKQIQRTKILYTVDRTDAASTGMKSQHRLNDVVENKVVLVENGKEQGVSTQKTNYTSRSYKGTLYYLPDSCSTSIGNYAPEKRTIYTYDDSLNVRSISLDGMETVYLWSYKGQYPIAKIEGLTYAEVENAITKSTISDLLRSQTPNSTTVSSIRTKINAKGGYITTYTYKPLVGILSETQPNGNIIYYEYDSFGRLKNIKDYNKKIIKTYEYHYYDKK